MFNLNQPLLTESRAAELLGVTTEQLTNWRSTDTGPEWLCIGRRIIRYEPAAICQWLDRLDRRHHEPRHRL